MTGPSAVPVVIPASAATLDETFARLRALTPYVDGRVAGAGAAAPAAPAIDVEALLEGVGAARATGDQRVRAMLGLHGSVFYRVMPALGAFLAERRVPCLDPAHTGVDWDGGDVPGRLTTCGAFTALAEDPAADLGRPPRADDDALAASLHAALVDGVAPLVAALARHGPLGERVLWLSASDTIAGGMLWLGELLGREDLAAREAERLLRTPGIAVGVAPRRDPDLHLRRRVADRPCPRIVLPLVAAGRRHVVLDLPRARRAGAGAADRGGHGRRLTRHTSTGGERA